LDRILLVLAQRNTEDLDLHSMDLNTLGSLDDNNTQEKYISCKVFLKKKSKCILFQQDQFVLFQMDNLHNNYFPCNYIHQHKKQLLDSNK
jgi:hypothetical protein